MSGQVREIQPRPADDSLERLFAAEPVRSATDSHDVISSRDRDFVSSMPYRRAGDGYAK